MEQQKQVVRPATIEELAKHFNAGDFVRVYAVAMDVNGSVIELDFSAQAMN